MEQSIHKSLIRAVSEKCNCTFTSKFLRIGEFHCWNSPTEVTYRSSVVGTPHYASSHILNFIESWVRSKVAMIHRGQIVLKVMSNECAVGIPDLEAEECKEEERKKRSLSISSCIQSCAAGIGSK